MAGESHPFLFIHDHIDGEIVASILQVQRTFLFNGRRLRWEIDGKIE